LHGHGVETGGPVSDRFSYPANAAVETRHYRGTDTATAVPNAMVVVTALAHHRGRPSSTSRRYNGAETAATVTAKNTVARTLRRRTATTTARRTTTPERTNRRRRDRALSHLATL
jgi:hypothetical protein